MNQPADTPTGTPGPNTPLSEADEKLLNNLIAAFYKKQGLAKEQLEKFSKEFLEDPVYALKIADPVFLSAAHVRVCSFILKGLCGRKDGETYNQLVDRVRASVLDRILEVARNPQISSLAANCIDQKLLVAWAIGIENLDWYR